MTDSPTAPLVERVTQGPVTATRVDEEHIHVDGSIYPITKTFHDVVDTEEMDANAELIAEAFNVAHETGMTPRELADSLKAIDEIIFSKGAPLGSNRYFEIRKHSSKVLQRTKV